MPPNTRGTVDDVDSIGYIHVSWDNGRKIPINPDTDEFRVLTPEECFEEHGERMESDFIDGVNQNVIPKIDMKKLGASYDARDTAYPTEVLKMLHDQFIEAYGTDSLTGDVADFVIVPGVVLGANNKIYVVLLELDLSSSGEHWNTQFFTPCGVYSHISDNPNLAAQKYMKGVVPYRYWYTPQYSGDIHIMSWVGGKKALREEIVSRLNQKCDRYVEVFGGGGWVLFHKPPGKFEVYNDFNSNLANLYRCVRDHPEELCEELRYTLEGIQHFQQTGKNNR